MTMVEQKTGAGNKAVTHVANALRRFLAARETTILLLVSATGAFLSTASPYFLTVSNLRSVLVNASMDGIMIAGMTVVLIGAGIDLSVGSTTALVGVVTGLLMVDYHAPIWLAFCAGMATGLLIGLINGLLVTKVGANPIITTLAMLSIVRGTATIITKGIPVSNLPKEFVWLGDSTLLGIPTPVAIMLVVVVLTELFLRRSHYLRQLYYIGGNEPAARLSGIKVDQVKIFSYCFMGFLAALAGEITTSRYVSAASYFGIGAELRIIAAAVIGGVSIAGGSGSLIGALLGLLLMSLIGNMFGLLNVDVFWQTTANGLILLAAVLVDTIVVKRKKASRQ